MLDSRMEEDDIKALADQLPVGITKEEYRVLCKQMWYHRPRRKLLKLKKQNTSSGTISSLSIEEEKNKKNRQGALKELKLLSHILSDSWNALGLLGLFYSEYQKWCLAEYRHGSFTTHYALMKDLVKREGPKQTAAGIVTLFNGKPLDWVTRKELEFLTDPSKWSRFVAPAIVQAKPKGKGEQSEWEGNRDEGFTVRRRK